MVGEHGKDPGLAGQPSPRWLQLCPYCWQECRMDVESHPWQLTSLFDKVAENNHYSKIYDKHLEGWLWPLVTLRTKEHPTSLT